MAELRVNIGDLKLKNPVMTASGTFGYGVEFQDLYDINCLGGILVKGTTLEPRQGNPYPRMAETPSGMLNAVGLQNKGLDYFISNIYPRLKDLDCAVLMNACGSSVDDYTELCRRVNELPGIDAVELNISCPNVKKGGMAFGTSCAGAAEVTRSVRKVLTKPLIVKLSPNVTDITEIAKAVEAEGADGVSLVNTFLGMAIDIQRRRPKLSTITGGLSGPCIRPIAVRMVWQVAKAVNIPVVGLGGIMSAEDAIEFLMAGATAIELGTGNFVTPDLGQRVTEGIGNWCDAHGVADIHEIIGCINS